MWVRDPKAATWDGVTGHWWDDSSTDEKAVHSMTARMVENLTGSKNGKQAWDALFRNFNLRHCSVIPGNSAESGAPEKNGPPANRRR